jgi:hypothetical protein
MNTSSLLTIELSDGRGAFAPGQTVSGIARWRVDQIKSAEIRLFWYTRGTGTRDVQIVESQPIPDASINGEMSFSFSLPDQPYSFSGSLITLRWAVELVIEPAEQAARAELFLSPCGTEITLSADP